MYNIIFNKIEKGIESVKEELIKIIKTKNKVTILYDTNDFEKTYNKYAKLLKNVGLNNIKAINIKNINKEKIKTDILILANLKNNDIIKEYDGIVIIDNPKSNIETSGFYVCFNKENIKKLAIDKRKPVYKIYDDGVVIYDRITKGINTYGKTLKNNFDFNKLLPELTVSNINKSYEFYKNIGFEMIYERKEDKFIFLELNKNQIMIQEDNDVWSTGKLEYPYGRGINFSMEVKNVEKIRDKLINSKYKLFQDIKETKYDVDGKIYCDKEFLVQDPDGYLLRFTQE